jgi:hypothetical protein
MESASMGGSNWVASACGACLASGNCKGTVRRSTKLLIIMYYLSCLPSFNWKKNLDDGTIARFQRELGAMGYKFQFITCGMLCLSPRCFLFIIQQNHFSQYKISGASI